MSAFDAGYDTGFGPAPAPPPPPPPEGGSPLTDLRLAVAAALDGIAQVAGDEWVVIDAPVDALEPPAYLIQWGPDPWRVTETMCADTAQLEVVCVAARLTPEANYPTLEEMVDAACVALMSARLRPYQTLAPGPFEIAQITYLAARVQLRQYVTVQGA